ncbi:AAA family ATPase [Candidatus Nitrosocosmicus franklandus]|uniref:Cytidylate kinase n=1 Tax=Candidatus Nitrosocosmicus franklandianus TaxID=1798806 RepID=A0A484IBD9_9ARCH|nr:cytidylate kinase family protein [Candidatus Nitrosocosmicus franklandus]VFJ15083.1 Cytidylate kinase [Candidatus Nitrosocosmicus franklandus]
MESKQINDIKKNNSASGRKISIVISGWPAVGKTTIAVNLAKDFNLKLWNGGDILKMMAYDRGYSSSLEHDWWDTEEAAKFMNERNNNPNFDREVDNRLIELLKGGDVVITSYTLPWIADATINFWLQGSVENRSKRMSIRDNIDIETARKIVQRRDFENKQIYKKLYQFEFGEKLDVFDFSMNTDILTLESLITISKLIVESVIRN